MVRASLPGAAGLEVAQPMGTISNHAMRSTRRLVERMAQQPDIKQLEAQLSAWWWSSDDAKCCFIDLEVLQRLHATEPGIRVQMVAQHNDDPHHSSRLLLSPESHIMGNGAKHYFPQEAV